MAGSIESKIANWPAVRPPILRGAAGWEQRGDGVDRTRGIIHDAARPKALRRELVVVRRVQRVVVNRAFDGHLSQRLCVKRSRTVD